MEKEKELASRIESENRTKQRMVLVAAIAAALLVFASYVFYANRKNKRANLFLATQKQQIERKSETFAEQSREIAAGKIFLHQTLQSLLPSPEKFSALFPDAFLLHHAKEIISGDFLAVEPSGGSVMIFAGRCAGEGIPAAIRSAMILHSFQLALRYRNAAGPAKLIELLNTVFSTGTGEAVTFILLSIDRQRGHAEFLGNGDLLVHRKKQLEEYAAAPFAPQTTRIKPGDILYLSSDRFSPQIKSLLETTGNLPLNEQNLRIEAAFFPGKGSTLTGDLLLTGIRI